MYDLDLKTDVRDAINAFLANVLVININVYKMFGSWDYGSVLYVYLILTHKNWYPYYHTQNKRYFVSALVIVTMNIYFYKSLNCQI
jgi:hypothetical protein